MTGKDDTEKRAAKLGYGELDEVAGGAYMPESTYNDLPRMVGGICPYCALTRWDRDWKRWHVPPRVSCQFGPYLLCLEYGKAFVPDQFVS